MEPKAVSRKEKRKALKKDKRRQIRKELAEKARAEEEARLNDPQVQREIELQEERERERLERERKEFEERERVFLEELERKKKEEEEEEEERKNAVERESKDKLEGAEEGSNEDDEWEYVEEGPPEIIWQGNEIIVKKNKVRVKKKDTTLDIKEEDPNRPTSNPLPPQNEAYAAFKNAHMTSAELLDTVAHQVPNFGTEQDKAHCPFHIKTGACRFGLHCNRVHYYPDKSHTLLIKNMYNGPGLAWEQDEGLEVCRNGSFHLRGNVYIHYKSLDSAVMAYSSVHGRYFAGKQVKCEFVTLTRWKVAICGEYMKSRFKTCSRGSACNFLHCFRNPGGDYEWADLDKPPPRYWVEKMTALFGYSDEMDQPSPKDQQHSPRLFTSDRDSYHYKRHRSLDPIQHNGRSSRSHREETHARKRRHRERQEDNNVYEDEMEYKTNHQGTYSNGDRLDRKRHSDHSENHSVHTRRGNKSRDNHRRTTASRGSSSDEDSYTPAYTKRKSRHRENISESSHDPKTKPSEGDLSRHKQHKTKSTRRSSQHDDNDEVDRHESKKDEEHNRHQLSRSRSRDSPDKHDTSDRWQPNSVQGDHSSKRDVKEHELSDVKKPKDKRRDRETRSGSVVEDASKEIHHSCDRDDRTREKRKRI